MAATQINVIIKNSNINLALKEWKRKSFFITKELKDRKEFEKPSAKNREIKKNAIYGQKMRNQEEEL